LPQAPQLLLVLMSVQLLPVQHEVIPVQQKNCPGPTRHTWPALPHVRQVVSHGLISLTVAASSRQRALQAKRLGLAVAAAAAPPLPTSPIRALPAKPPTHFSASRRLRAPAKPLAKSSNRLAISLLRGSQEQRWITRLA